MKTIALELVLRPNVGWVVPQYVDGQYEGAIHTGFLPSKEEARDVAEKEQLITAGSA